VRKGGSASPEDDGKWIARGANIRRQSRDDLANAYETTRSTNICSEIGGSQGKLAKMKIYRGFPERLHHRVPHWVEPGALFHVRIALNRETEQRALTNPLLAPGILDSAKFYEAKTRWHITLFLLMPDHLHAILSFTHDQAMSEVIRDWKRFHARANHIFWQEGYFDHRLRADERGMQLSAKLDYIRRNPVAAGLCARAEDWPWVIDPFVH
jgi:REP element-mobilizing transposase RayT